MDLAGEGRKGGHSAGGARTDASWQSVSLIRRGTGLCATHCTPAAAGTPSGGQAGGDAADAAQGGPETGESQDSKPVAVIDLSGDGDGDNGGQKVSMVISS